jgi:hypothetical protein
MAEAPAIAPTRAGPACTTEFEAEVDAPVETVQPSPILPTPVVLMVFEKAFIKDKGPEVPFQM